MGKKVSMYPQQDIQNDLLKKAKKNLLGRTIVNIRFMTDAEIETNGWDKKGIVLTLNDKNIIFPMTDGEGNDAGAIGTSYKDLQTIPTI